ncbi:Uncharacterized protein GBIM_09287 [Gryllus bimaculatus]|nr:Uncharacterized protein GBIM_09287 [Gryllus bimaculatus]
MSNSETISQSDMSIEKSDTLQDKDRSSIANLDVEMDEIPHKMKKETELDAASMDNETDDPYAYLNRNDFTSEKFKIEIRGLPKFYGINQLRKLLNEKLQLGCNKVKPLKPGSYWAFVCFRTEEDRTQALNVLNGYKWKGNELTARVAKPCPDPLVMKRKGESQGRTGASQNKLACVENLPLEKRIKDSVSPLWNLPYKEQLGVKEKAVRGVLLLWAKEIQKLNPQLKSWLNCQREKYDGLPCVLHDIRPSPKLTEYRNKCEFTVGINEETKERTVGFRIGSYMDGSAGVAPVDKLDIVPVRMKAAAKIFEQFVQASPLGVFCPETHEGVWRQLMARLSTSGALMLVIGIHPQNLTPEQLVDLKEKLKEFFANGAGSECKVDSLFLELLPARPSAGNSKTIEHLYGETSIFESVCDLNFRISPEAFFQVNTGAAEVLYNTIAEFAKLTPKTTLLDVCCGTGTIGLCLAKHCGQVIGVEISKQAVEDAKANAARNSITNCEFFAGSAEELLSPIIHRAVHDHVVAVVDPPRAGLHQKAMTVLRNAKNLNHLVYVSCDPKAALNNLVLLTRSVSKSYYRPPFVPVCAVPVDIFPGTNHCELVIYMERFNEDTHCTRESAVGKSSDTKLSNNSAEHSESTKNCSSKEDRESTVE